MAASDATYIWTRSKQSWVGFAEGDETFEAQPSEEVGPGDASILVG